MRKKTDYSYSAKGGGWGGLIGIIMLIAFLFPGGVAFGQYPLPGTPTPTSQPDGGCPNKTPLPTPLSIEYNQRCFKCVPDSTPIIQYPTFSIPTMNIVDLFTPTPGGSTATPGSTSTPESTGTPTPDPTISQLIYVQDWGYNHTFTYLGEDWDFDTIIETGIPFGARRDYKAFMVNNRQSVSYKGVIDTSLIVGLSCGGTMRFYFNNRTNGNIILDFDDDFKTGIQTIPPLTETLINTHIYNSAFTGSIRRYFEVEVTQPKYFNGSEDDFNYRWYYQLGCANSSYKVSNNYQTGEFDYIPEPTPMPGYCEVYDYQSDEQLTGFTGITITQGECFVIMPEWTISLPEVSESIPGVDLNWRGISICPKWVDLGTFNLAGMEIPADIIAIPAVMFLITLLFLM